MVSWVWKNTILAFVLGCTSSAVAGEAQIHTPCDATRCYLCCSIRQSKKTLELCGVNPKEAIGEGGPLVYRFGRPDKVELEYPMKGQSGHFKYSEYVRAEATRIEVSFETNGAEYTLYDYDEAGKRSVGVRAAPHGRKQESDFECIAPSVARLGQLRGRIPCDPTDALNMGTCPEPKP